MSARAAAPFSRRVVLALVLAGAGLFLALLVLLGTGMGSAGALNNGRGHAASKGLTGYAALYQLLERQGVAVSLSREAGAAGRERALLVLTPEQFSDPQELDRIIAARRFRGPTLVILPKWQGVPADPAVQPGARRGWVGQLHPAGPDWLVQVPALGGLEAGPLNPADPESSARWEGFGLSGSFPQPEQIHAVDGAGLAPLVRDGAGRTLVAYLNDGDYPQLEARSLAERARTPGGTGNHYPVVLVAEPDLFNNWGMADASRARLALAVVAAAQAEGDGGEAVVFDLTQNGLGASRNLLTLAFAPPFLAATLCLILALLLVGWRAWRRFGPPVVAAPELAFGKSQLVANSARLVQRTGRLHLLGPPFAGLMLRRLAAALGLRGGPDTARIEAAADRVLAARGLAAPGDLARLLERLRQPGGPRALVQAAHELRHLERTVRK